MSHSTISPSTNIADVSPRTNAVPKSPRCDWTAYYDPMEDNGIAFYSHEYQCSLATTFRSLHDPATSQSNGTVLRILNLKLEASCTMSASEASSRLFLIETTASNEVPAMAKGAMQAGNADIVSLGYVRRAVDYLAARHRLGRFKKHHGHLQEDGVSDVEGETQPMGLSRPELLACSLYLSSWVSDVLFLLRFTIGATKPLCKLRVRSRFGLVFVLFHLCAYYVLRTKTLYSSRAAGLLSTYNLTEYILQWM